MQFQKITSVLHHPIMKSFYFSLFTLISCISFAQSDTTAVDSLSAIDLLPLPLDASGEDGFSSEQQDISSLLQSSRDVFNQFAGFQFGTARYRSRGLNGRHTSVAINGVVMNEPESGTALWSTWGGLGDVIRFPEVRSALAASRDFYSGIGGFVNFETEAGLFKKGQRITYSAGNRVYQQRLLWSANSGASSHGWALSIAGSVRYGNQVYIPGTFYHSVAQYFSISKSFGKQRLSLIAFVSPSHQGRSAANTREVTELCGTPYYNSSWGLQNNVVRNANVARSCRPVLQLLHTNRLRVNTKIQSSLTCSFGKNSLSGLTWYDAENPDPDYYRSLPSWYLLQKKEADAEERERQWRTNEKGIQQIQWDELIAMNRANLYSLPGSNSMKINTTETRARYIVEQKVEKGTLLRLNSVFARRFKRHFLSIGCRAEAARSRKYKELEDLLGASYWLDVDQFAEDLGIEEQLRQNDIDNPNKKIRTKEKFGYDYWLRSGKVQSFFQNEFSGRRMDWYFAAELSYSGIQREGLVANGKFPESSKGKSASLFFLNAQLKSGLTYKFSGRHFITLQASEGSKIPEARSLFISPTTRNTLAPNIRSEKFVSTECAYHVLYGDLRARFSFYHTDLKDLTVLKTYWHDQYNSTINLLMTGISQRFQGIEAGIEKIIQSAHTLQMAVGYGHWIYLNAPVLSAWQDNTGAELFKNRQSYLRNLRIGGTPQRAIGGSYRFSSRRYWTAGISCNYLDKSFVEPNPDRRTEDALGKYTVLEQEQALKVAGQEELPAVWFINLQATKSYRFRKKYNFNVSLSLNNIFNQKSIISGVESLRWDSSSIEKFPTKYTYMQGLNSMLNITLNH